MPFARLASLSLAASIGLAAALPITTVANAGGERCRTAATHAALGPPLLCVEIDIGDAKSLPWGKGAFDTGKGLDRKRIVRQTLEVLKTADSTLVRMETLRRATVHLERDEPQCESLLARLAWIALDQDANPNASDADRARAWFDAGYFAACLWHAGLDIGWKPGWDSDAQGYSWLTHAIRLSGGDPTMHFATANAVHPGMRKSRRDLYEAHMRPAIVGAGKDGLLRRNIDAHLAHWNESEVAILRTADGR